MPHPYSSPQFQPQPPPNNCPEMCNGTGLRPSSHRDVTKRSRIGSREEMKAVRWLFIPKSGTWIDTVDAMLSTSNCDKYVQYWLRENSYWYLIGIRKIYVYFPDKQPLMTFSVYCNIENAMHMCTCIHVLVQLSWKTQRPSSFSGLSVRCSIQSRQKSSKVHSHLLVLKASLRILCVTIAISTPLI